MPPSKGRQQDISPGTSLVKDSKEATEGALKAEGWSGRNSLRAWRRLLIGGIIGIAVLMGVLDGTGIWVVAHTGPLPYTGLAGGGDTAIATAWLLTVFVALPIIGIVGLWKAAKFVVLGVQSLLDTKLSSSLPGVSSHYLTSVVAKIFARVIARVGLAFLAGFVGDWIASSTVGLVLGILFGDLAINFRKPYIAYLLVFIDALVAGFSGDLAFIGNVVSAVKPFWTSGVPGALFAGALFALLTGFWTFFQPDRKA